MICSDLAPPYIGGGESYVINLGSRLVKLGHEVHWVTSKLPNTKYHEIYQGIYIHRVPILFSKHYLFPGRQFFPLTGLLPAMKLAKRVDVLQFNTFVAGTFGWLVSKFSEKPCLLWCHEMFGELWKKIGRNLLEKEIYPYVEKFIACSSYDWFACPSNYSKRTLIKAGAPKEKITVIPHGIDFEMFHPNIRSNLKRKFGLEGYKLFGFTGRLAVVGTGQSKNLLMLLEATKYIVKQIPNARLVLGGSGFNELKPYIEKLGIKKYVVYTGRRPFKEVPRFLSMCDCIVCPAIADGYCFLLAESSACGKPVVATNVGSHPERVINNKTGILTSLTPEDLAEGIMKVLNNPALAKKFGANGAKYTQKFTWESSVEKHLEVYNNILEMV